MSLGQDVRQNFIIYHKTTIIDLLSSFGGQAIAIIGISGWLLSGYQQFLFEKSRLQDFVFEKTASDGDDGDGSDSTSGQIMKHIKSLQPFSMNYLEYRLLSCFSSLCCKCCCNDQNRQSCYGRRMTRFRVFNDAKDKLVKELDMRQLLMFKRIGTMVNRVLLKRY